MEENTNNTTETKTTKKHSNLTRTLIAITLASIIAVVGAFIKSSPHNIKGTINDVVNDNKENTLFDDILDLDETIGVTNTETGELESIQVEDAIRLLERKMEISKKIRNLHIKKDNINELDDDSKKNTLEYLEENGIDLIIEFYNDKDNNKIEKARIAQKLLYIEEENNKWLKSNGIPISKSILYRIISSGGIQAYGTFKADEYADVIQFDEETDQLIKKIEFTDPKSGVKDNIILFPILAPEYYKAIDIYQNMPNNNDVEINKIYKIVNNTLITSKRCINKELKKDNIFVYTYKQNNNKEEN